jgi:hypothetical protein
MVPDAREPFVQINDEHRTLSQQCELISFFRTSSNVLISKTDRRFVSRLQEKLEEEANLVDPKKQLTSLTHFDPFSSAAM